MKSRVIKTGLAFVITASMLLPNVPYGLTKTVKAAESKVVSGEIGDTNGDGIIDAIELVRLKKSQAGQDGYTDSKFDLNNDGKYDAKDMKLMHEFLLNKITSFYRPDTSANNNDTSNYTVTDELDREMTVAGKKKNKTVGIRYFLHFGTGDSNQLYSVSNILATDSNAASSDAAWTAAGGGAVGTKHWWGEPLFGYYISTDAWVIDRDVQMLTDAGIDFIAVDTTDGFHETELTGLMNILSKYDKQGFVVPKVAFTDTTSIESELVAYKSAHAEFDGLWYETASVTSITNKYTVKVADNVAAAMSASAFYGETGNHTRSFDGYTNSTDANAILEGYNFGFDFESAIKSGKNTIFIESWNEWIATRKEAANNQAIVLEENADINNSSDIQPMKDGYSDNYYMQMVNYIKQYKGKIITNTNLNTASTTENVGIDVNGDFNQWNKVSTHYLDYTSDIENRSAGGYTSDSVTYVDNHMAAIKINRLNESSPASFITKKAYAGGSTVSFRAYVPEGAAWWAVCWTTDLNDTGLYGWTNGAGQGMSSVTGQWANYSVTLPNDSDNYYVYLVGAKGEWPSGGGTPLELLVDDFKITSGDTVVTEKFDNGLSESIFSTAGNDVVNQKTVKEVKQNKVMAIDIDQLNENGQMNVTTKNAYASGCTISFKACAPEGTSWFALGYTSQKNNAELYKFITSWSGGDGTWKDYSYTVPKADGNGKVYFTLVGAKTEWKGKKLLIDDFKIETADGTVETDNFDSGLSEGLFDVIEKSSGNGSTVVSSEVAETSGDKVVYTDESGRNDISKMKMTTDGINLYAYVETVDEIKGFGNANCMSLFLSTGNAGGCYNQYEYVVNRNSANATANELIVEKYVAGVWQEAGKASYHMAGNKMQLAIPLTTLGLDDSFKIEFKWADNYSEDDISSFYTKGDAAPYGRLNYVYEVEGQVAAIKIHHLHENQGEGKMNFITKNAYKGGSTVSFKAFIPQGASWANVYWTTSKTSGDIYGTGAAGKKALDGTQGEWKEYALTLPTDSESYYLYLAGPKGEWGEYELLVDNFMIQSEGKTYMDTFNAGYTLFDVIESDSNNNTVVSLQKTSVNTTNKAAAIDIDTMKDNSGLGKNMVTRDAYSGGSTMTFRAYVPENTSWWGVNYVTSPELGDIYGCASHGLRDEQKVGKWAEYTVVLPDDSQKYYLYFGGAKTEWNKQQLVIDDVKIYNKAGKLIAKDNFTNGLDKGIFDVTAVTSNNVVVSLIDASQAGTIVSNGRTEIGIAAYSAPTINRKTKAEDKEKLDAAYEKLAEAGFTKAIAMTEGYPGTTSGTPTAAVIQDRSKYTEEEAAVALDIAEKYNIKYLVKDWSFYGLGASKSSDESAYNSSQVSKDAQFKTVIENVFDTDNTYVKHNAYAGNFAFDEPYLKDMDAIATQYKYFNQQQTALGFGGEMFVNLYGSYISKNSAQLGNKWEQIFGSASGTYDGYVDTYLEKVGVNLGYICWDNYPFMTEGHEDKAERDKNYLSNYELIANKCKDNGVELRTFVQSSGDDTGLRSLEGAQDIRYQMYSGLAFGTQEFIYYHYQGTSDSSNTNATSRDPKNFMYDYTSQTYTQVYDWAKEVNTEIHTLDDIYTQYKWVDIAYMKGTGSTHNAGLDNLSTKNTSGTYGDVSITSCDQDTLVGIFNAKDANSDKKDAYMFVNVSNPTNNVSDTVTATFASGTKAVAVWQGGVRKTVNLSDNTYTFTLRSGEGAFIIPLTK